MAKDQPHSGSQRPARDAVAEPQGAPPELEEGVRPDLVQLDPEHFAELSPAQSVQSLLGALAQAIDGLSVEPPVPDAHQRALQASAEAVGALGQLVATPRSRQARIRAFQAASRCALALHEGPPGAQRRLVRWLGGRCSVDSAALHSVLLPHSVAGLQACAHDVLGALQRASGEPDLPASLFDWLVRAGAPTSLRALGVADASLRAALSAAEAAASPERSAEALSAHERDLLQSALRGRRPCDRVRREDWGLALPLSAAGPRPESAETIVVALHGRGSNADVLLQRLFETTGDDAALCVLAPQAVEKGWYRESYRSNLEAHAGRVDDALAVVGRVVEQARGRNAQARLVLVGFSQGACLALEYAARARSRVDGVVAFSGARIGPPQEQCSAGRSLEGMPVLCGGSTGDPWVSEADVRHAAAFFEAAGARVQLLIKPGEEHEISAQERFLARELLLRRSVRKGQSGYGNTHQSESLEGALPPTQNSPLRPRYGLVAEQVNGTGFVASRAQNRRSWLYRMRPSAQHSPFQPTESAGLWAEFDSASPEPNLAGWGPLPIPTEPCDFVDGLRTFGGSGSAQLRRGFAIHLYAANRSMEQRSFYNADGELLLVPQLGSLTLLTELGLLEVAPGQIAIVPRGLKFSVLLRDSAARGYVAEVYGRSFALPERGPIGANGLSEARHFTAPSAYHENRLSPGYRISAKFCGELFEARQDYSPYDVAAWHGNYAPYSYDLSQYSPVNAARFDHPDPSIFTVLSAPLDEQGANCLDFVFFPPRWETTEGTFRPPFFHRNAVSEFNAVLRDPQGREGPFYAGGCFVTPPMTAHGIRSESLERYLALDDEAAAAPKQFLDSSIWIQFETALPIALSPWARHGKHRIADWHEVWGNYRSRYSAPRSPDGGG